MSPLIILRIVAKDIRRVVSTLLWWALTWLLFILIDVLWTCSIVGFFISVMLIVALGEEFEVQRFFPGYILREKLAQYVESVKTRAKKIEP